MGTRRIFGNGALRVATGLPCLIGFGGQFSERHARACVPEQDFVPGLVFAPCWIRTSKSNVVRRLAWGSMERRHLQRLPVRIKEAVAHSPAFHKCCRDGPNRAGTLEISCLLFYVSDLSLPCMCPSPLSTCGRMHMQNPTSLCCRSYRILQV